MLIIYSDEKISGENWIPRPIKLIRGSSKPRLSSAYWAYLECQVAVYIAPISLTDISTLSFQVINYDSRGSRVSVITDRGTSTKTILLIHDASNAASGTYTCAPSPSAAASVKIHILNGNSLTNQTHNIHNLTKTFPKDMKITNKSPSQTHV